MRCVGAGLALLSSLVAMTGTAGCVRRNPAFDTFGAGTATGSESQGTSATHDGSDGAGSDDGGGSGSDGGGGSSTGVGPTGTGGDDGGSSTWTTATGETSTTSGAVCGNGVKEGDEECDDGNTSDDDGCLSTCEAPDPIIHLPFEESAVNIGTLGAAHDGIESNVSYVPGKVGTTAVLFHGAPDSRVTIPGTRDPLSAGYRYTIGLWFREDQVLNMALFLLDFRASPNGGGFQTYHGASGENLYQCYSAAPVGAGCENFAYEVGTWHHLLYRCEGTDVVAPGGCDLEIYLDDVQVATFYPDGNVIFSPTQALDLLLGINTNFEVDDFRIYDRAFDPMGQCEIVIGGAWDGAGCTLP